MHSPWIQWADVRRAIVLAGGGFAANCVPQAAAPAVVRALLALYRVVLAGTVRSLESKMGRVLRTDGPAALKAAEDHIEVRLEDMWGRLRGMRRYGWQPEIEWDGFDHLERALAEGRGVVIWSMRFSSATVIKQGFHHAGLPLVHLSRFEHGSTTKSRFGLGAVGPMYCRAENCYLKRRVVIPADGSLAYLAVLREALRAGELVSIFGEHAGRQNHRAKILGTTVELALGAPSLAWLEGVTLLTAAPLRVGPLRYRLVIDEPIPVDNGLSRRAFATLAAEEFARRLEARVLAHPADWQGWLYRAFPD